MPKVPSAALQRDLREKLLHAMPGYAHKEKALLTFFFDRSIRGGSSHLTVREILESCADGPKSENAIYNAIGRVRDTLKKYFEQNQSEPIRVELELQTHILRFIRNWAPSVSVAKFWEPYFSSFRTTMLYYPEPQFFRHRNGAYLRHPLSNWRDQPSAILRLLSIQEADLIPSYSFVPSGVAAAMATLFACFHCHDAELRARPLNAAQLLPEDGEDAIVLGTPTTSLELISSVERDAGMRTARENDRNIFYVSNSATGTEKPYVDEFQEEQDFKKTRQTLTKWAVVTRRFEPRALPNGAPNSRVITVLAGHSRSLQGATEFLTNEEMMKSVSSRLSRNGSFQAFFGIRMDKNYGELERARASLLAARTINDRSGRQRTTKASARSS